jgi:transposase
MEEPSCPGCRALTERIAQLEAQIAELTRHLEEALRAGKRQAAPFRKGPPKPDPKTPGRKAGDAHGRHGHRPPPPPEQVSEYHDAPLPGACPHCQGQLIETSAAERYQTEIPRQPRRRTSRVHLGHCDRCGRRVRGRHPLQTSDALGAAASQLGAAAQAAATPLHTQAGLSHGKVAAVFTALFGIDLTRGASAPIGLRAAARLEPDSRALLDELPQSTQIAADETGWRIGGQPAWLHVWVGDRATAYGIDPRRSAAVLEEVIGADGDGILGHDGWASDERFAAAIHQQCVARPLRRARLAGGGAARGRAFPAAGGRAAHWGRALAQPLPARRGDVGAVAGAARRPGRTAAGAGAPAAGGAGVRAAGATPVGP